MLPRAATIDMTAGSSENINILMYVGMNEYMYGSMYVCALKYNIHNITFNHTQLAYEMEQMGISTCTYSSKHIVHICICISHKHQSPHITSHRFGYKVIVFIIVHQKLFISYIVLVHIYYMYVYTILPKVH